MPVVAVINRKGGSGKSTLATHLAGHLANSGLRVMLGDVDRQQSSLSWLRRRAAQPLARGAPIFGWAVDVKSVLRHPLASPTLCSTRPAACAASIWRGW